MTEAVAGATGYGSRNSADRTIVALANLTYFGIEFVVALRIGSASLFADSADFFEDASVNLLIFVAMAWSARDRARVGMAMSVILLFPAVAFLWTAWNKFEVPIPPEPFALGLTGLGALVVNVSCAYLLAAYRNAGGSLTKAAFLSARNDAFANVAIIAAGAVTFYLWRSPWPDLIVGFGIAWMNLDAAKEVWVAAHEEHRAVA
ncbi:cation transporter [Rhizobium leguminosarum]|uniref:cation transporter n=1 Tax=Rhizobium leguminosarum TaxID=384 RepID=UPI001C985C9A|nr:cation transporter [Rhizobium leguminosarum]MBY5903855.1 cation transporter [Rhizobium leguminosarum]MBY5911048.1 cation transporter [Rhizobium leguminosarum]